MKNIKKIIMLLLLCISCDWVNSENEKLSKMAEDKNRLATPAFDISSGTYDRDIKVSIYCATPDAVIYYTIDGTTPTINSLLYNNAISVTGSNSRSYTTIKAMAFKEEMISSRIVQARYCINYDRVSKPYFSTTYCVSSGLSSRIFNEPGELTIATQTENAHMKYTTDGTDPRRSATAIEGNTIMIDQAVIVKAYAYKDKMTDSDVATVECRINSAPTRPGNIGIKNITSTGATLIFEESNDNDGSIAYYNFYLREKYNEYSETPYYKYTWNTFQHTMIDLKSNTTYYMIVTAVDNYGKESEPSEEISFTTLNIGKISDMVAVNDPDYVYAIDQDKASLYKISTRNQCLEEAISLPDVQPIAMSYSSDDNKIYIVSKYSGEVTVYDLERSTLSKIYLSEEKDGYDIAVAPSLRKIFVIISGGYNSHLLILDMDTETIVNEYDFEFAYALKIDEKNNVLYISVEDTIEKYIIANDMLLLKQSIDAGPIENEIILSPDGEHLATRRSGGRIAKVDVYCHANVLGEWDIENSVQFAAFSPDNTILYGNNTRDNNLYVMDTQTYREIRRLEFPVKEYAIFTPNSDGTAVVGFSCCLHDVLTGQHGLYYFTDVTKDGYKLDESLGKISDMAAGNDPDYVYALDQDHMSLYKISIRYKQIEERIPLPDTQPLAMSYSSIDNKLFIVSKFSGSVTVYDIATSTLSQISFSEAEDAVNIAVAPLLRRVYVATQRGYDAHLFIIDMDNGSIMNEYDFKSSQGVIAINEEKSLFYIDAYHALDVYDINNDMLILSQNVKAHSIGGEIVLSADGEHLAAISKNYGLADFDAGNPENCYGEWSLDGVANHDRYAAFSHNSAAFYSVSPDYDDYFYVYDAETHEEIRKLAFPNASDYAVFTVNSDDSVVVGFSYDTYYDDKYNFYYFTDVKKNDLSDTEINNVTDIVAVNNADYVYAIDQYEQALYQINIKNEAITKRVLLPDVQPIDMNYSSFDNKLFIASKFSGKITVYDLAAESLSQISVLDSGSNEDIVEVVVAPLLRRLFVRTKYRSSTKINSNIYIIDLDSESVKNITEIYCSTFVVDENRKYFFVNGKPRKYLLQDDTLQLLQTHTGSIRSHDKDIVISHNKEHVIYYDWRICYDVDTQDLDHIFHYYTLSFEPYQITFSPDDSILYCINSESESLYVMDTTSKYWSLIRKLDFPNADNNSVFTVNSDGSAIVGFSSNREYYKDMYVNTHNSKTYDIAEGSFYFFRNIKK